MDPMPPPPPSEPVFADGHASGEHAGFWRRFAGALIDGIILSIPAYIIYPHSSAGRSGIQLLLSVAYFTLMIGSSRGQTVGQMALGIKVVDVNTGESIGYGRALVRWLVSILSAIVIFLGYFWMIWDKEKQCWHDKAANDYVVPVKS
ncbi:MAG TPA: RDD family protein [Gaiellaceae bacterium]